jgi:hypothetical protein
MKRAKRAAVVLGIAGVLGCIGASAASALLPAFRTCVKAAGGSGNYGTKSCGTAGGSKAWGRGPWNTGGTSLNVKVGETNLYVYSPANPSEEWAGGVVNDKVTCRHARAAGQLTASNMLELTIQWKDCLETKSAGRTPVCVEIGGGYITSTPLVGTLGYLGSSMPPVGVVLEPKSGSVVTEFECFVGGTRWDEFRVTGAVIGEVEGITNSASKKFTLALRASSASGAQEWTGFNGSLGASYLKAQGFGFSGPACPTPCPAGLSMTASMKKSPNLLVEG